MLTYSALSFYFVLIFFYWAVFRFDVVRFLYSFVLTLFFFHCAVVQSDVRFLYSFVLAIFLLGSGSI